MDQDQRPPPCATCPLKNLITEESPHDQKKFRKLYTAGCDKLRAAGECYHDAQCRARAVPSKKPR